MNMHRLMQLLPPPISPIEIPTQSNWADVESRLGKLPTDYHEFIETYGSGLVDEFLWIFSPCSSNEFLNLECQARVILGGLAGSARKFPNVFAMPRHPEPGGLLPFGGTDNGDNLFWVTNVDPDSWTVAVMGPRSADCFFFEGGMTDFLCSVLEGKTRCTLFPEDFPSEEQPFEFSARAN